ncbi:MAG: hypothetical protein R3C02_04240 [Planctomycetaceae bacterium]
MPSVKYGVWAEEELRQDLHGHSAGDVPHRQAGQGGNRLAKVKVAGHVDDVAKAISELKG